ncbi:hypothetical protein ACCO45_003533 [Purpureocillium lilacinum]|uniref:Uncharacterized protein n=1 Tax=Purpureocillium lilacinum TaxID=33203 RepID=A0ACC4E045_PURLI
MSSNKQGKMIGYINWRMRIILNDGRQMTGQMLAFDKHMNLVLADTEEFRRVKRRQAKSGAPGSDAQVIENEEKRTLGLTIVRGAQIISVSVESPPPPIPAPVSDVPPRVAFPRPSVLAPASLGPLAVVLLPPTWLALLPALVVVPLLQVSLASQASAPPAPFGRGGGPPPGFPGQFPPPGFPGNFRPPAGFPGGAPGVRHLGRNYL